MVFDNSLNVVYNNSRNDVGVYVRPVVIILRVVQSSLFPPERILPLFRRLTSELGFDHRAQELDIRIQDW